MKNLLMILTCLFTSNFAFAHGSMVGGGDIADCNLETATLKAHQITDRIAMANYFDLKTTYHRETETEQYYEIQKSYDQGLSVPTYKVRILKSPNCMIMDIVYSNQEG